MMPTENPLCSSCLLIVIHTLTKQEYVKSIQYEQAVTDEAYREPSVQPLSSNCYPYFNKTRICKKYTV